MSKDRKYASSRDMIPQKSQHQNEMDEQRVKRKYRLRQEWLEQVMKTEVGQEFFHELIFERNIPNVGLMGLHLPNINGHLQTEGARAFQSQLNEDLRRAARPSDYAQMITRPLGGKHPDDVTERERKQ